MNAPNADGQDAQDMARLAPIGMIFRQNGFYQRSAFS